MALNWWNKLWSRPSDQRESAEQPNNRSARETGCYFCGLEVHSSFGMCIRCGGELEFSDVNVRFQSTLQTVVELLRKVRCDIPGLAKKGHYGAAAERLKYISQLISEVPTLIESCESDLIEVGNELDRCFIECFLQSNDMSCVSTLRSLSQQFIQLAPSESCESLIERMTAGDDFFLSLQEMEEKLGKTKPSTERLRAWLQETANAAVIDVAQAIDLMYLNPERWPKLAAAFDQKLFQNARWNVTVAKAEKAIKAKQYDDALRLFSEVLDAGSDVTKPTVSRALEGQASLAVRADRKSDAIGYLRKAIELGPMSPRTYNNLSWYLCTSMNDTGVNRRDVLDESYRLARIAVRIYPVGASWDTLAEILVCQGDVAGAVIATREAIRANPAKDAYRTRMKLICEKLKNTASNAQPPSFSEPNVIPSVVKRSDAPDVIATEHFDECCDDEEDILSEDVVFEASDDVLAEDVSEDESFCEEDISFDDDVVEEFSATSASVVRSEKRNTPQNSTDIPLVISDQVHFSVTTPTILEPGNPYLLDVWAHLSDQRNKVIKLAKEMSGEEEIRFRSKGGVAIVRGSCLTVQLKLPGFIVNDASDVIQWEGEIGNASFPIEVPTNIRLGKHLGTVLFATNGFQVAKLQFDVEVGDASNSHQTRILTREDRHQSAFASYCSTDRDEVLARIQGLQKAIPRLNVFLDVASLRSGQNWAVELEHEINNRDVFYLFWSQHAKSSKWVDKEWRTALRVRGIDYIDPVPLVDPIEAPPPEELAGKLHFNDWILAYMRR